VEPVFGILQAADAIDQTVGNILLVEHWQLHGDARHFIEMTSRCGRAAIAMLVIQIDKDVAMHAIRGEKNQDHEVRDQQPDVECVGVIEPLECAVEEMLADVGPDAFWGRVGDHQRQLLYARRA
jgi:hypothetical protein